MIEPTVVRPLPDNGPLEPALDETAPAGEKLVAAGRSQPRKQL